MTAIHRGLRYLLWRLMLAAVVCLAIYVAGTRAILKMAPLYQDEIVQWLSGQTGLDLELENMSGDVINFQPSIQVSELRLMLPEVAPVSFAHASLTIDPWATLMALELRLDALHLSGITADLAVGQLRGKEADTQSSNRSRMAAALLSAFRAVTIENAALWLDNGSDLRQRLNIGLELRRLGSERQLRLELKGPQQSKLTVSGSGVGDIFDPLRFRGDLHGHLEVPDASWLADLLGQDLSARVDVNFWFHGDNQVPEAVLVTELTDLSWGLVEDRRLVLDHAGFTAGLSSAPEGWIARIQSLSMAAGNADFALDRLQLESHGLALDLKSTAIDLDRLARMVTESNLLPAKPAAIVSELQPSGSLLALEGGVENITEPLSAWSLTTSVRDVSVQARKKVPALLGMDGTVVASRDGATAWIDTQAFTLDLPEVYRQGITLNSVLGQLSARWDREALYLYDGVLQGEHDSHDAKVLFGIDIPLKPGSGIGPPLAMYLDVGVPSATTAARHLYVPFRIPRPLKNWLDTAIGKGQMSDISFIWRGGFKNFGLGSQSMQLAASLSEARVAYQPDWPAVTDLSGSLHIDTDRVSVWGDGGAVYGLGVRDVSVEVDAARDSGELWVAGQFQGDSKWATKLLRESPIYGIAAPVLDDLEVMGPVAGQLNLKLDFRAPSIAPEVRVVSDFSGATVGSKFLSLNIEEVTGGLDFDYGEGFASRDLRGLLFEQPLTATIGEGASGLAASNLLEARFSAPVSGDNVERWGRTMLGSQTPDSSDLLSGHTELRVAVSVLDSTQVQVGSSLEGLLIDLPVPLGKVANEVTAFSATLDTATDLPWDIFWQGRGQGRLFRNSGKVVGLALDLTPRTRAEAFPVAINNGIRLYGEVERIELDPWLQVVAALELPESGSQARWPVRVETLGIREAAVGTFAIEDIVIDITPFDSWHQLGINTAWLDAELTIPDADRDVALIINSLDYDQFRELSTTTTDSAATEIDKIVRRPPRLPQAVDVTLANLQYRGQALGAARFRLRSSSDVLVIDDMGGQLAGLKFLDGSVLKWAEDDSGQWTTQLSLNANMGDLQRTFDDLSMEPLATTRSGDLSLDLGWPGGPTDIDLLKLSGTSRLTLIEGSFLPVPASATGAARIFSLLNLAGLFGRADVTRIFDPGVTFRSATGDFVFTHGGIQIPHFDIRGTGGGFNFSSDIDLLGETIDGELVVTLPLVENIPWMAALVGGLPVAAGAYLLSKVFERQVKSLSSGVYAVQGDLYSPEVTFVRIFDAGSTPAGEPSVTVSAGDDADSGTQDRGSDSS